MFKFIQNLFNKTKSTGNLNPEKVKEYYKLFDTCNRSFMYMILPNMVKLYKNRDKNFKRDNFYSKEYYKRYLQSVFGEKVLPFSGEIIIEKTRIANSNNLDIYILNIPNCGEVGQIECSAVIFDLKVNDVMIFHMEHSFNNTYCLCEWDADEKKHYNYGIVDDKKNFVLKILELSNNCNGNTENHECLNSDFEKLDVKHRLAKEIGVKYEMLDFYMSKFQEMIKLEMNGVDSSKIYEEISDLEEWSRYCQWEVSQAKKRMSKEDLEKSHTLFDMMINRDKLKNNSKWN